MDQDGVTGCRHLTLVNPGCNERLFAIVAAWASEHGLSPLSNDDVVAVWIHKATRVRDLGGGSVLLGEAMASGPAKCQEATDIALRASGGRLLLEQYWGDYVALIRMAGRSELGVVRPPCSQTPLLRRRLGAATLLSSELHALIAAGDVPGIDWGFVAEHVAFRHLLSARTGIDTIEEVFPGDFTIEGSSPSRTAIWSPWRWTSPDRRIADASAAAGALRSTVDATVASLTDSLGPFLLELSGGLDSSIVAAALHASGSRVTAVNFVTPGPEGDERRFARQVADRFALALTERSFEGDTDFLLPEPQLLARPGMPALLRPVDAAIAVEGSRVGAAAFVSGTGGDSVFCSLGSAVPAIDRMKVAGIGASVASVVRDLASVHETTLWNSARHAWRAARRATVRRAWPRTEAFVVRDALPERAPFHPWLEEPEGVLPGSRTHVRSIMAALAHLDGYPRHAIAPSIFPLLAQPVVELSLRIPTWLWVRGGRDRSVARAAYADALPLNVARRRGKGAMDSYCHEQFEAARDGLREFLLDGMLADAGILDRDAVGAFLSRSPGLRDNAFYHLVALADVEAWSRGTAEALEGERSRSLRQRRF